MGPTIESGVISADSSWKLKNSPYIIQGSVNVSPSVTLTIEAGVVVKFDGDYNLVVDGTLLAIGTAEKPITFTSNQTFRAAGNWGEIQFRSTSADCQLQHVVIEYGQTGIRLQQTGVEKNSPQIQHCTIQHHSSYGIYAYHAYNGLLIQNSTISNNGAEGVYFKMDQQGGKRVSGNPAILEGNTITGNQQNGLYFRLDQHHSDPLQMLVNRNSISSNERSGVKVDCDGSINLQLNQNQINQNKGSWSPTSGSEGGIRLKFERDPQRYGYKRVVSIRENVIKDQASGAGIYEWTSYNYTYDWLEIIANTISGNKVGLVLDEPKRLMFNNLQGNSLYGVYIQGQGAGDFQAGYNWWGSSEAAVIGAYIRDFHDDFNYYRVDYSPLLVAEAEIETAKVVGPASPQVVINQGAAVTESVQVELELSAEGATEMMVSEHHDFAEAEWQSYANSLPFSLSIADGIKYVYVKFRNAQSQVSAVAVAGIKYDKPQDPGLSFSPQALDFGAITLTQRKTLSLNLANSGEQALTISHVSTQVPFSFRPELTFPLQLGENGRQQIDITFHPPDGNYVGQQQGQLLIKSNDPLQPELKIPLNGEGMSGILATIDAPTANQHLRQRVEISGSAQVVGDE
ncbi:MAG: right-handed parallel beta-helix repeat-containing protein, partial [Gammaproteobacteria bacterium]|nr:right-handed parallel beta-helix repeat-containing protein [Gammaproteobacteria bacterium]